MYALIELVHGDFGPAFETRPEAEAALARMEALKDEPGEFGVFQLDVRGFPIDPPQDERSQA
jgi:hypothetical protein